MIKSGLIFATCLSGLLLDASPASARSDDAAPSAPGVGTPGIVQQYCTNIRDAAADSRTARQLATLETARMEVAARIAELNRRQAEFEDWLARRNAFMARVQAGVVEVYANMRPDAAASQLAILDTETAASVLANLKPEAAGEILNEMEPHRAAKLVLAIAGPTGKTGAEGKE